MKKITLLLFFVAIVLGWASTGKAQWATTVGGWQFDVANSVVPTTDGGFMVAGATRSFNAGGGQDGWLFKMDGSGVVEWEQRFDTDASDSINDLATRDGMNIIAVGGKRVTRFNTSGGIVWQKEIVSTDDFFISSVAVDASGNSVLAGTIYNEPNGNIWVVKIDAEGNILWQQRFGEDNIEFASDVLATTDGGYLVTGVAYSFGPNNGDIWLIKLDAGGGIIWQRTFGLYFGGNENIETDGYTVEKTGGYLLAAHTAPLPSGNSDLWVLQLDLSGVIQWQKLFETGGDFAVTDMVNSGGGGTILVGLKGDLDGTSAFASGWTMKLDAAGTAQWVKNYMAQTPFPSTGYDTLYGMTRLTDGRLGLVGGSESFAIDDGVGPKDAWVFLTDAGGTVEDCAAVSDGVDPVATDTAEPDVTTTATAVATTATIIDGNAVPEATLSFIGDGCQGTVRNFIDLPKSGLATSYYDGDDGDLQAGVAWPSERFVDNGNGTVNDRLTGLMWLKDANCADTIGYDPDGAGSGKMAWASALDYVAGINSGTIDISDCSTYTGDYNDWRLANVNELASLVHAGVIDRAAWLNEQGFQNTQDYSYWSSTPTAGYIYQHYRWVVEFDSSRIQPRQKSSPYHAWLVRGGQEGEGAPDPSYPANVWRTGRSASIYPGDDGELMAGVRWPGDRFVDNGDGTSTDSLTGLTWLQDAECLGQPHWQEALDRVADFNINPGAYSCFNYGDDPISDWRLPNIVEFRSLLDFQHYAPALPTNHPFVNFQGSGYIWTSNTEPGSTLQAWSFVPSTGSMQILGKTLYGGWIIPVRGELGGSGDPVANIMANGSDGPVTIAGSDNLTVTVSLQAGSHAGDPVDYWLLAQTPAGWYYYRVPSGWKRGLGVCYRGPVMPLSDRPVLNMTGLPAGGYVFNFGIDLEENGVLDLDQFFGDEVTVTITP